MPTCMRCGKTVPRRRDLDLVRVRVENGGWEVVCHHCATPASNASTRPVSKATADCLSSDEAFEKVRKALESLLLGEEDGGGVTRAHSRKYERTSAELTVTFTPLRDDSLHSGQMLDMSPGGIRFATDRELTRGQIIQLDVRASDNDEPLVSSTAEVRRVALNDEGLFEIGARYVQHRLAHASNRRRYRRFKADMAAYYQRPGADCTRKAEVLDLSQGGVRLRFEEPVQENEEMAIVLRGLGGRFTQADLYGLICVVRVSQKSGHQWEAGCRFQNVKAQARTKGQSNKGTEA